MVQRWLDAGLVIFGKTNTPEFGTSTVTESELFGPACNPWNTDCTPGGSSGGAAAAVAAGIVPCAGASDGGGSIRIPASACGLFGLKASRGLIPAAARTFKARLARSSANHERKGQHHDRQVVGIKTERAARRRGCHPRIA